MLKRWNDGSQLHLPESTRPIFELSGGHQHNVAALIPAGIQEPLQQEIQRQRALGNHCRPESKAGHLRNSKRDLEEPRSKLWFPGRTCNMGTLMVNEIGSYGKNIWLFYVSIYNIYIYIHMHLHIHPDMCGTTGRLYTLNPINIS